MTTAWLVAELGASPSDGVLLATTAVPSPSPSPNLQQEIDPGDVSPGLLGFLPVFAIALVCLVLFGSLTSKLRKVNRRQALLDAEDAAQAAAAQAERAGSGAARAGDGPDDSRPR